MAAEQQHDKLDEVKACTPADAKASLRRVVAFGGGDGYGQDKWNLRMAQCIEDLEVALASQIEITNTERAAKERLERELAGAKERAADNAEAYENAEAKWYAAIQSASVPETGRSVCPDCYRFKARNSDAYRNLVLFLENTPPTADEWTAGYNEAKRRTLLLLKAVYLAPVSTTQPRKED